MSPFLSSGEIGRVLGVSVATVRRWADAGLLPSRRTAGGHRRFSLSVAEQLARQRGGVDPGLDGWVRLLAAPGDGLAVDAALLGERSRAGSWRAVAETVGGVLDELGARWQDGALDVADEHVASVRLGRALARAADSLPHLRGAPRAILATVEGEAHTLGLSLVELCMRERGWPVEWLGRDMPTELLARRVGVAGADALAVSASIARRAEELAEPGCALAAACAARRVELVVGGRGPWPERLPYGAVVRTFPGLEAWMEGVERRGGERVRRA